MLQSFSGLSEIISSTGDLDARGYGRAEYLLAILKLAIRRNRSVAEIVEELQHKEKTMRRVVLLNSQRDTMRLIIDYKGKKQSGSVFSRSCTVLVSR